MQFHSALLACALSVPAAAAVAAPANIVPQPKECRFLSAPAVGLAPGAVAIVLGATAAPPEQYAAETLRKTIARTAGVECPVVKETAPLAAYKLLIVLGQRSTNAMLDKLLGEKKIDLSENSPGFDGYVIDAFATGGKTTVIVGGCNARGVIYGQDTLGQLIRKNGSGSELIQVSIRDWPSIPWRGKPQTSVKEHYNPGVADWYALSRYNFVDIRDGIYAFRPDATLPVDEIKRALGVVHGLGMIAYGTVDCAVSVDEHPLVLKMFKDMVDLGVDGLWLSFDDHGWGEDPAGLCSKVLDFGKQHGITGQLITLTPPKGSYQNVLGEFNKKIVKVPGMEEAVWYFTELPSQKALDEAKSIGMKTRVGWWHNWPRSPMGSQTSKNAECDGFLLSSMGRADGLPPYMPVPRLKEGWNEPSYEYLKEAETAAVSVMEWGGSAWKHEYTYPVLGWWGWSPKTHSWDDTRHRIYSLVFGENLADSAKAFDDSYRKLTHLMIFGGAKENSEPEFPPRLADQTTRPQARELVGQMRSSLEKLQGMDPTKSVVPKERLDRFYLGAMKAETDTAASAIELAYPEYWWDAHQRSVLDAIYAGNDAKANSLIESVKPRVIKEARAISQDLPEMAGKQRYEQSWIERANMTAADWRSLIESRKQDHKTTLNEMQDRKIGSISGRMMKGMASPPDQVRSLYTISPVDNQQFWGFWTGGFVGTGDQKAYCFTYPLKLTCREGEYCEVPLILPNHGPGNHRALQFFLNTWANDNVGLQLAPGRWLGRNFVQLKLGDKVLWEADAAMPGGEGQWITVPVPPVTDGQGDVKLALRVETRSISFNCGTVVIVGPFRVLIPDG